MMGGKISGFEWDDGNWPKCSKHGVSQVEIENVFSNNPVVQPDPLPEEPRFRAIGRSDEGRYIFVVFILREIDGENFIRPISARYMHEKERLRYVQ